MNQDITEDKKSRSVSFSQYQVWSNCPLDWKLRYADKLKPDDRTIHLVFGNAIHDAVQFWLSSLFAGNESNLFTYFLERLTFHFKSETKRDDAGNPIYISTRKILNEFYLQGIAILNYLWTNKAEFFSQKDIELVGVEVPLEVELRPNVKFRGYLDIVTKNKITGQVKIFDLKTSGRGWNKWHKNDPKKINQLLLYKHFYSKKYGIPEEWITIEFIILSRELRDWYSKRITKFQPKHDKEAITVAMKSFNTFVDECFDVEGNYKVDTIKATPSKHACRFCPFNNTPQLCSESMWKV